MSGTGPGRQPPGFQHDDFFILQPGPVLEGQGDQGGLAGPGRGLDQGPLFDVQGPVQWGQDLHYRQFSHRPIS